MQNSPRLDIIFHTFYSIGHRHKSYCAAQPFLEINVLAKAINNFLVSGSDYFLTGRCNFPMWQFAQE